MFSISVDIIQEEYGGEIIKSTSKPINFGDKVYPSFSFFNTRLSTQDASLVNTQFGRQGISFRSKYETLFVGPNEITSYDRFKLIRHGNMWSGVSTTLMPTDDEVVLTQTATIKCYTAKGSIADWFNTFKQNVKE